MQTSLEDFCLTCAQAHPINSNHVFHYSNDDIEDLNCDICLSPFLSPMDLKCGHTFCSICLDAHLEKSLFCPICNEPTDPDKDVWKSCIVLNKLLDKFQIYCPYESCRKCLSRGDLQNHLQKFCHSHSDYLAKNMSGFPKPKERNLMKSIKDELIIEVTLEPSSLAKDVKSWGLRYIGGKDTPIKDIVVQDGSTCNYAAGSEIMKTGDIITNVHNIKIPEGAINHEAFKQIIQNITFKNDKRPLLRILVKRKTKFYEKPLISTIRKIKIPKRAVGEQMGMRLVVDREYGCGIYVSQIIPGKLIARDGRIEENDRILEINGLDLRSSISADAAMHALKSNDKKVEFTVMRVPRDMVSLSADRDNPSRFSRTNINLSNKNITRQVFLEAQHTEKHVVLRGRPGEQLGLALAGGRTDKFRLPCFVQQVVPGCLAHRDGGIKVGDFIIGLQGQSMIELSVGEISDLLRKYTMQPGFQISITLISLSDYKGIREDRLGKPDAIYRPSWKKWLLTPGNCLRYEVAVLECDPEKGFGMTFSGGWNHISGDGPVFIS